MFSEFSLKFAFISLLCLTSTAFHLLPSLSLRQHGQKSCSFSMVFNFKTFKEGVVSKMTKSLESTQSQLNTLRAGQAR